MREIKGRYDKILKKLRIRNQKNNNYSLEEIQTLVKSIYDEEDLTPIVKISEAFGLNVYKRKLAQDGIVAEFLANGNNKELLGINEAITVDSKMSLYDQRFFTAYELGYYLFYYVGSESEEKKFPVHNRYMAKNEYITDNKLYRFAVEILMPEKQFMREYIRCIKEIINNDYWATVYLSKYFYVSKRIVRRHLKDIY